MFRFNHKSVLGTLRAVVAVAFVIQAPVACALPDKPSPSFMSQTDAKAYCDEHEPNLGIYCTDVYEGPTEEKALNSLVNEYCSWIDRNVQSGWGGKMKIIETPNGPTVINTAYTDSIADMGKFYDRVRVKGLLPDSAPKDFASALSEHNWWREGCWMFNH